MSEDMSEADFVRERKAAEVRRASRGGGGNFGPKKIEGHGVQRKVGPPLPMYDGAFGDQVALNLLSKIGDASFYEKILRNLDQGLGPDGENYSMEKTGFTIEEYRKSVEKRLQDLKSGGSEQIQKVRQDLERDIEQKSKEAEDTIDAMDGVRVVAEPVTDAEIDQEIGQYWNEDDPDAHGVEEDDGGLYDAPTPPIADDEFVDTPTYPKESAEQPAWPKEEKPKISKKKAIMDEIAKMKKSMDDKIEQLESLIENEEDEE